MRRVSVLGIAVARRSCPVHCSVGFQGLQKGRPVFLIAAAGAYGCQCAERFIADADVLAEAEVALLKSGRVDFFFTANEASNILRSLA